MKFRTAYSEQVRKSSDPGDPWKKIYTRKIDENGKSCLVETGEENLFDKIQSVRNGLLPADLVARFNRGDTSAIRPDIDSYRDLSNVPSSLGDALNAITRTKELYASLPDDVRATYNHDINQLVKAIDDGSFFTTFAPPKAQEAAPVPAQDTLSGDDISKLKKMINGGNE